MDQDVTWYEGGPQPRPQCIMWGPSSPPTQKRGAPIFGPCLLWPNGWVDQDATWYGGKPWPRQRCVRWEPSSPKSGHSPPIFGPCLLWPKGWMDQDVIWYAGRPRPRRYCVRWGPASPPQKKRGARPPICRLSQLLLSSCLALKMLVKFSGSHKTRAADARFSANI